MANQPTFAEVLQQAVADISENGFTSAERLGEWQRRLADAVQRLMGTPSQIEQLMRDSLNAVYRRLVERGGWAKYHPGIARFTVERVLPQLRADLDRRIWSNASLIKLNREQAMAETLRRFSGWASSVPPGGSAETDRSEVKASVKKPLYSLPFVERRCAIDQGHKLFAAINETIAIGGNAIAAVWHHHHVTYPRKEHVAREGKVFLIRDNWAQKAGLVKNGENGYTDEIERPGEFVYCRCSYQWLYSLRALPPDMLTAKGKAELERVKVA